MVEKFSHFSYVQAKLQSRKNWPIFYSFQDFLNVKSNLINVLNDFIGLNKRFMHYQSNQRVFLFVVLVGSVRKNQRSIEKCELEIFVIFKNLAIVCSEKMSVFSFELLQSELQKLSHLN